MSSDLYYLELQTSILEEHNKLRQNPKSYLPILSEYIKYYKGDVIYKPREIPIQSIEGVSAVVEAIEYLMKQQPVGILKLDERLSKACEDHIKDIGPKGLATHDSGDGKNISDRVDLYAEWDTACGENINLGSKNGKDIIISLIVDDGFATRIHRKNLFSSEFKFIGIASGEHVHFGVCSVINYVGGLREKETTYFNYKNLKLDVNINKENIPKIENLNKSKIKSSYQLDDMDAPDGTISVKITKITKIINARKIRITRKNYSLQDGSNHIIELEDY